MVRQSAGKELGGPFASAAALPKNTERHRFPCLERALNARHISHRIDRLAIDLHEHVTLLHTDVFTKGGRLHGADQNSAMLLDAHLIAAGVGKVLNGNAEAGLGSLRRTSLF